MTRFYRSLGKCRRGQGLLETIVAFSVLIVGIVTLMSLVVSASIAQTLSAYETTATELAREGVEVAVSKRNDNWINDRPFDQGMSVGTDYTFGVAFNPVANAWTLVPQLNLITDDLAKMYQYNVTPFLMVQGTSATPQPAGTVATIYRRLVALDPICVNDASGSESIVISGSSCVVGTTKKGVRITSSVQWKEHNRTHNVNLVEMIYDWR